MKKVFLILLMSLFVFTINACNKEEVNPNVRYFRVIFENNNFKIDELEVKEGDLIDFPKINDRYSRVLYWTLKGSTEKFDETTRIDRNLTLTPVFEFANIVGFANTRLEDEYVFPGEKVKKPKRDPEKANYLFAGWYEDYQTTIPFNFDKVYDYVQHITIYAKWEDAKADLYYRDFVIDRILYYEVYMTKYASEIVTIPSFYLGTEIYELYQMGEANNVKKVIIPMNVHNIIPKFFYASKDLEEIEVHSLNMVYKTVDGVLYRNPSSLVFYPMNKKGDTFKTDVEEIGRNAFSYNQNLKTVIIENAYNVYADAFSFSNILNVVINKEALIDTYAFKDYSGNVFLDDDEYAFNVYNGMTVYKKGEWEFINEVPTPIS